MFYFSIALFIRSFLRNSFHLKESARPLPRPPKGNSLAEDLPPSRSPRARRRYKVSSSCLAARSQYAEDEEEEDDINSEARC
mgnify:CR=1 FL=1